jgi:hypothetical protein
VVLDVAHLHCPDSRRLSDESAGLLSHKGARIRGWR